ncbi:hypothetical protein O7A70_31600 [Mesorhizobium sp. Cs1299R1N1]|uniref:hypothetical protein n=1 Tax=Mesorhizobium sp. Cs1299R1N1 TaxID=3015172 RepID=UPI00301CED5D
MQDIGLLPIDDLDVRRDGAARTGNSDRAPHLGRSVVQNENIDVIISVDAMIKQSTPDPRTAISLSFSPYFSKDIDIQEAASVITAAARRIGRIAVS